MKVSIRQKLFLFSLIFLAGNGILGYAVYQSNQKLFKAEQWVLHTEQVLYQSGSVLSVAKDIETASNGFVITNDTPFLKPLYSAERTALSNLNQLKQLTHDNATQQQRIDSLDFYMRKLLNYSSEVVQLRSKHGLTQAIAYAATMQSDQLTNHISQITHALQNSENELLKIRKQTNGHTQSAFKITSQIVFISMIMLTILSLIFIGKYLLQNKEKEKHTAELAVANEERTKMVNDLMVRNKDLEQFAYIISHNLRAPVANIIGASSALSDLELSTEDKEIISRGINVSIIRLDDVVKDLNHILEIKAEINKTNEVVYFSELVNDIKISIKNLIDANDIEIKCDFTEINELVTLKAYLYSVFYNLISNSIKYRRQQVPALIEIKSHLVKSKLQIVFKDNGMGIDLKKSGDLVFGLYKRFHTNTEGKGMGLFMVKTQVEALGGNISVHSAENKGTEFKIEFTI